MEGPGRRVHNRESAREESVAGPEEEQRRHRTRRVPTQEGHHSGVVEAEGRHRKDLCADKRQSLEAVPERGALGPKRRQHEKCPDPVTVR